MTTISTKTYNILFSTTRTWNCGDDFILWGVRDLLDSLGISYNPIAYNRNPDVRCAQYRSKQQMEFKDGDKSLKVNVEEMLKDLLPCRDNSWQTRHGIDFIDYCIFAGSPEWLGTMLVPLTKSLSYANVPIAYLGIGYFWRHGEVTLDMISEEERHQLKRASLITVRDAHCQAFLNPIPSHLLPCPALFSAPTESLHADIEKISVSLQSHIKDRPQRIPVETVEWTLSLIHELKKHYQVEVVLHYLDEVRDYQEALSGIPIHYSYEAKDYLDIYQQFDFNITTRVHGAGICASLGIPSFLISHSARSQTAEGFLSEIIDPNVSDIHSVINKLKSFDVEARSKTLLDHKKATKEKYLLLLKDFFN